MRKICSAVTGLIFATLFLGACATVEKQEIRGVKEEPKVSKTIAHEAGNKHRKTFLKRKVAIGRFTNETKYGQSFFIDKNDDRIGKQAVDILSSKLVETEKFILIERADFDKITKELQMEDLSPLKSMVDYLIIGSVTEFGRKDQGKVGIFSRTKRQTAFARVHIRLIEVRTGKIIYSEEGEGEATSEAGSVFGVGERAGYDSTLNDKALDAAITNLSSNIIENLLDKPWRSYILGFEDSLFIIGGGKSQNINAGDVFAVVKRGKDVKNPQTNMMITLPGKPVGNIRVVSSTGANAESEVSFCEVIEGNFDSFIKSNDFTSLFVQER